MANGTKSNIGTYAYLRDLSKQTIFDGVNVEKSYSAFFDRLKEISENAAKALETLYDDIERNKSTIQFMEKKHVTGLENLANQLYGAAEVVSVSIRRSESNIKEQLKSYALPSKYSMREVEKIADEIKKGTLNRKLDDKLLESAKQYHLYRSEKSRYNKGKNGKLLGTQEHSESVGKSVFCSSFTGTFDFRWYKSYVEMIQMQIVKIANKLKYDIENKIRTDYYIEYPERKRILEIIQGLAKYCPGSLADGLDKKLEKLRRLEDFDNKVIEIDMTGPLYPVDAKLEWKDGKNYLTLSTNVKFDVDKGIPQIDVAKRKQNILDGFEMWGSQQSHAYKVFNDQEVYVTMTADETYENYDAFFVHLKNDSNYGITHGGKGIFDWSPLGEKNMWVDGTSPDLAKHEFGHALGLGDAYRLDYIKTPHLYAGPGVDPNYSEYKNWPKNTSSSVTYSGLPNFVMNDNGPIMNNDIEMVILAFSTGKRQNYQEERFYAKVSSALDRGN